MTIKFMADAEYFALDAIDQSLLKKFMISPKAYATAKQSSAETDAMQFGSLVHTYVLGSGANYAPRPNRSTKAGKEAAAALIAQGKVLVPKDDLQTALDMSHITAPYFQAIPGKPEMALLAEDPWTGIPIKGKADWLPDNPDKDGVYRIRDYKTTASDPSDFPYTAFKFGYHIQAAFYMMLARLNGVEGRLGFEFVVQEKKPPYDYMVWRFDEHCDEVAIAETRITKALSDLKPYLDAKDPMLALNAVGLDKMPHECVFSSWQLNREHELANDGMYEDIAW